MLPRERHRPRRRADRSRRRGAGRVENDEERILRAVRRIAEVGDAAARPARRQSRPRLRRRGRRALPEDVHHPRRHRSAGGTPDGAGRTWTVLVPADVVARSQTVFAGTALPPFEVKGKAEPIEAIDLGPVVGVRTTADRPRLPMVDRERELAVLSAALGPAARRLRHAGRADRRARDRQVSSRRRSARAGGGSLAGCDGLRAVRVDDSVLPVPRAHPPAARCPAGRRSGRELRGPSDSPGVARTGARPMDSAPGARARRAGPADSGGRRPPAGVSTGATPRRRHDAARVAPRLADHDPVRGRPLDGRGVDGAASAPRAPAPGQTLVRVHDAPPRCRRLLGGRRDAAGAGVHDQARPAPGRRRAKTRGLCRTRGPRSRRAARDRGARRRQPALPPGARFRARYRLRAAGGTARHRGSAHRRAHRPALGSGSCAASLGLRARPDLRERRARAGAHGRSLGGLGLGGVGPAHRVRRTRPQRRRRVPVPSRALPRRGVRGPSLSTSA